ncbi:MAG: hypothetical protein E6Q98_00555 [Rhodospirillaceae bacterium]|nr:MAG: hypothetical protein E6Q98_00555 [Rhodospirillaceae bacterium]
MSHCANDNPRSDLDHAATDHPQLHQLPFSAQLLVWGMRSWVTALKTEQSFDALTGDGFAQFDLGSAGRSLDEVFQILAVAASRPIDIRCVKCRNLSEDERLLLDVTAAGQADSHHLVYAGLSELLPPAAVRNAFPSVVSLAKLLGHAGLHLTVPPRADSSASPGAAAAGAAHRASLLQRAAQRLPAHDMPALMH